MSVLTTFVAELRERRLWPVVGVLLAAIVAVPIVLAKSPSPSSTSVPPPSGVPVSSIPTSPSVSLGSSQTATPLHGLGRDPFTPQFGGGPHASTSPAIAPGGGPPATPSPTASLSGGGGGSGGAAAGPATQPTTTVPSTTTTTPTDSTEPSSGQAKRPRGGLGATQAYQVTLAITNSAGGLDTLSPLERLSVLPSQRQPLLVELGVAQGGHSVLFAVQPGAIVRGPGRCIPGPIDCQILSLSKSQTETLSSTDGAVSDLLLAVTALTSGHYPSAAAARKARRSASPAGRRLLSASSSSALRLFQYDPALGAVLDLRNLHVRRR
jgi:hypothetical protein